jgi:hypothetical protein
MDNVVFQPKNITPQELLEGVNWIKRRILSLKYYTQHTIKSVKFGFYPFLQMTLKGLL